MGNEIKNKIACIRRKAGDKTGFAIPSDYFNNLEDALSAKFSEENFTKENSFKVPDAYFNNLENLILAKVESTKKETNIISFKERVFKMIPLAAAASIILFIGLNSFVFNTSKELNLDTISDEDINLWLDFNTLTSNEITFVLEETILDENEFYFSQIKDKTIEDYLNNSIDHADLLNEIN
jgi:exosome complex RNA-binding protein Rrp4